MAFLASSLVMYSTKANPRWEPSNFLCRRRDLTWPKVESSWCSSLFVHSKARFLMISLAEGSTSVSKSNLLFILDHRDDVAERQKSKNRIGRLCGMQSSP